MFNVGTIDFKVYEDGDAFIGIASTVLPNKTQKTVTVNGAGLGGDIEVPIQGQYESMELTLNFRAYNPSVAKLREPRRHTIDMRVAEQYEDPVTGVMKVDNIKHIMVVVPKSSSGGTVAPASANETNVVVSVRYWATFVNGEMTEEFDPVNGKNVINGIDFGAPIRQALGM
jgi:hypothetical protein